MVSLLRLVFSFRSAEILQLAVVCKHLFKDTVNYLRLSLYQLTALLFFLDQAIETIFDLDLSASLDKQAYLMPFASMLFPELEDLVLFLGRPLVATHVRINDVDPPLATLARLPLTALTDGLIELFGDARPLFWLADGVPALHALRRDIVGNFTEDLRFAGRPGRLLALDILDKKPPLLALTGCASGDQISNSLPVCVGEVFNQSVSLIRHVHDNVSQKHRLIFLPLGVRRSVLLSGTRVLIRLVIDGVDSVSFSFVDDSAFKQEVVPILESDYLLLLVRVDWSVVIVDWGVLVRSSVPNHIVGEV